jgi:hypothetical protein
MKHSAPLRSPRTALAAIASLLAPLAAQQPTGPRVAPFAADAEARGLESVGGVLTASGAHWKATLTADGVAFVPALGRRSPRPRPLAFELLSFGRADGAPAAAGSATPVAGDFEVRYARTGIVERYAVLPQGLEQSFVFAQRPRGSGDLVVRGRVRTDLPLARAADGALRFVDPPVGGVSIGGVTGIDAVGRRAAGALRCERDAADSCWIVELSLPAAFVDGAELPLVLDPFFGPVLTPSAGPDDMYCDVAYEPTHDTWLFVWDRSTSVFQIDLVGQRFSGAGTPIGGLLTIASGLQGLSRNRVVTVDARDAFVVAWWDTWTQSEVSAASVHAATGVVHGPLLLGPGKDPDVSAPTDQDDAAVVVFEDPLLGGIRGLRLTVAPGGAIAAGPVQQLSPNGIFPIAPRTGGASGRLLIAWLRQAPAAIEGVVVDHNLQPLAGGVLFANPAVPNTVQLDGDGSQWIVAWSAGTGGGDVFCRRITFDPALATLTTGPQVTIASQPNVNENSVCVAWLGGAAAIGWFAVANFGTPQQSTSTMVATIDGSACTQCAAAVTAAVLPAGWFCNNARLAARPGGNGTAPLAMFTYTEGSAAGAAVVAHRFRSDDGLEWDRGGACGGGTATHGCAVVGNGGYALRVDGAPPLAPVLVVLGTQVANFACGSCTVVPDPATGTALLVGATSAAGTANQALPVPPAPALTGFRFFEQWLTWTGTGCFGLAASNALEIQLQ